MRKSHFVGASPCTTTTPFDMVALDELVRFHLAIAAIERLPDRGGAAGEEAIQQFPPATCDASGLYRRERRRYARNPPLDMTVHDRRRRRSWETTTLSLADPCPLRFEDRFGLATEFRGRMAR